MKKFILSLIGTALVVTAQAQVVQYGGVTVTNNTGTAIAWATGETTNWNAAVTGTKWDSFVLEVRAGSASALGGPINIRWSTSADGSSYTSPLAASGASGWFSAPLTTAAAGVGTWTTNITLNSVGFWRIDYATNQTTVTLTNFHIRAFYKPNRDG